MEAGGSWDWTIENGQYRIQSDGIDTKWYMNGSPHKGCFQYYHGGVILDYPLVVAGNTYYRNKECGIFCTLFGPVDTADNWGGSLILVIRTD